MWRLVVTIASLLSSAVAAGQTLDVRFRFPGESATSSDAGLGGFDVADGRNALETDLLDDALDGRLDRRSLFEAAFVAAGTADSRDVDAYRRRFEHWIAELRVSGHVTGAPRDRARAIHEFLHARAFTGGFCETSTNLAEVFEYGRFNCLSSVVLFRAAAERFELSTHAVEAPGHAYAVVDDPAGAIVVQTTCRDWFAALDDPKLQDAFLRRTLGDAVTTNMSAGPGRTLHDVALLAIIYYNRGVDLLEARRYEEALIANRTVLRLDPANTSARANLLATINNWSLELSRRNEHAEAVRLLEAGIGSAPDYALFHENLVALHQQRLARAESSDDFATHLTALRSCYERWQTELQRRGDDAEASSVAQRAAEDPFLRAGE